MEGPSTSLGASGPMATLEWVGSRVEEMKPFTAVKVVEDLFVSLESTSHLGSRVSWVGGRGKEVCRAEGTLTPVALDLYKSSGAIRKSLRRHLPRCTRAGSLVE